MSEQRLIDANALIAKELEQKEYWMSRGHGDGGTNIVLAALEQAPTVPAEVVVHCENCKHIRILNISEIYAICDKTNFIFQPFGVDTREFGCPYGERRGSEDTDEI